MSKCVLKMHNVAISEPDPNCFGSDSYLAQSECFRGYQAWKRAARVHQVQIPTIYEAGYSPGALVAPFFFHCTESVGVVCSLANEFNL